MKSVLRLAARPVSSEILARTLKAAAVSLKRIGRSRLRAAMAIEWRGSVWGPAKRWFQPARGAGHRVAGGSNAIQCWCWPVVLDVVGARFS
jgi:hypothetical protein